MAGWRGACRPFWTASRRPRIPAGPARAAGRDWPRKAGKAGRDRPPAPAPMAPGRAGKNTATASGEKTWKTRKWQMRNGDSLPPSPRMRVAPILPRSGQAPHTLPGGGRWPAQRRDIAGRHHGQLLRLGMQAEHAHQFRQDLRLVLQRFGGRRRLFHQGRVLLRHLVHLQDGLVDLLDAGALFGAGGRDFLHDVGHLAHAGDHFIHRFARVMHEPGADFHLLDGVADQGLDFLGGTGRALGQVAHFGRHDGETAPLLARPGRFTAAFKARMLVWKAMPSMTLMMSTILREEALIDSIVCTTRPTTAPPLPATSEAAPASALAWRALSAFCRTAEVSCSIEEAVSSSELACSSVRDDRSRLPWAISLEAVWMVSVPERTWLTMPTSLSRMTFMANSRLALSWLAVRISTLKSPSAIAPAILTAYAGSPPSWRVSPRVISAPSVRPAATLPSTSAIMKLRLA